MSSTAVCLFAYAHYAGSPSVNNKDSSKVNSLFGPLTWGVLYCCSHREAKPRIQSSLFKRYAKQFVLKKEKKHHLPMSRYIRKRRKPPRSIEPDICILFYCGAILDLGGVCGERKERSFFFFCSKKAADL